MIACQSSFEAKQPVRGVPRVAGAVLRVGAWNAASSVKLDPTSCPTRRGIVAGLQHDFSFQWEFIKGQTFDCPDGLNVWEPEANNTFTASGKGKATYYRI